MMSEDIEGDFEFEFEFNTTEKEKQQLADHILASIHHTTDALNECELQEELFSVELQEAIEQWTAACNYVASSRSRMDEAKRNYDKAIIRTDIVKLSVVGSRSV
jgi:hypothetical protein